MTLFVLCPREIRKGFILSMILKFRPPIKEGNRVLHPYDREPAICQFCHRIIGFLKFKDRWVAVEMYDRNGEWYYGQTGLQTHYHKCGVL